MATISDTTDITQPPQADFQPEAETTTDTTFGKSTEDADAIEIHGQLSNRSLPTGTPVYNRATTPLITNASSLPGAFFFLTMTYYNKKTVQVVAYDPWVVANNKGSDIQNFYKTDILRNLPYYEYFDDKATGPWQRGDNFYSGTYAKTAANKGGLSPAWNTYFTGISTSAIANGVNIAFWNQTDKQCGLFASAPTQKFDKSATTVVMSMYEGSHQNFIPSGNDLVKSAQVDFYAMVSGKLG